MLSCMVCVVHGACRTVHAHSMAPAAAPHCLNQLPAPLSLQPAPPAVHEAGLQAVPPNHFRRRPSVLIVAILQVRTRSYTEDGEQ